MDDAHEDDDLADGRAAAKAGEVVMNDRLLNDGPACVG